MNYTLTELYWPEMLGSISKIEVNDSSPYLLFKIQDAHFLLDTQQSIIEILGYLNHHFNLQYAFVEGAQGDFPDFSRVQPTLKPEEVSLLRTFLRDKTISGPEYFAITSGLPFTLLGVENAEQYVKNVQAQSQAYSGYKAFGAVFEQLEEYVAHQKASTYSQELLDFDQAMQEHEKGKIGIADFLSAWVSKYSKIGLDRRPNLGIFMKATEMEKGLVQIKVRPESSRLLQDIITILSNPRVPFELFDRVVLAKYQLAQRDPGEIKTQPRSALLRDYSQFVNEVIEGLVQVSLKIRQDQIPSREIYRSFIDLSNLCGLDIRRYPNLLLYTHYLHQVGAIKHQKLFEEFQSIIKETQAALFTREEEREVARAWRAVTGLHKVCRLGISTEDVDRFISEFEQLLLEDLIKIIKNAIPPEKYAKWDKAASFIDKLVAEGTYGSRLKILYDLAEVLDFDTTSEKTNKDRSQILEKLSEAPDVKRADLKEIVAIDIALVGAYRFFQMAPARGSSLAENTLRYMKDNGVMVAALVSGGFQTSHIVRVLEREAVSHMIIMPKTMDSDLGQTEYVGNFEKKKTMPPLVKDIINRAKLLNNTDATNSWELNNSSTRGDEASISATLNSTPAPTWSGTLTSYFGENQQGSDRPAHLIHMIDNLPIHHCQSTYCTNQANYWLGRIICIGDPVDSIVGWCELCEKYVCSRCTLKLEISESVWKHLPDAETVRTTCQRYKISPRILYCKRCGFVLQKSKYAEMLVLNYYESRSQYIKAIHSH